MENRMGSQIFAGQVLHNFALEIIIDDAGEEGEQRCAVRQGKNQKIKQIGELAPGSARRAPGQGEQMGKQRADERSCHAGNGEAANQTAHAGQKLIVKHQFAADAEEKREDQPQKKAIFQRARRMLFKRGMHGIGRRQQEQRGQDAVSEDLGIRIAGHEVRCGERGGQNGKKRQQGRTMAFQKVHKPELLSQ